MAEDSFSLVTDPVFVTSERIDRMGDRVMAGGAITTDYVKNPVVLLNHGGRVALHATIGRGGPFIPGLTHTKHRGLQSPIAFGNHSLGREIAGLWSAGIFSATSIGFRPLEYVPIDTNGEVMSEERQRTVEPVLREFKSAGMFFRKSLDSAVEPSDEESNLRAECSKASNGEFGGFEFRKWELFEFSVVDVPANPDAVKSVLETALRLSRCKGTRARRGARILELRLKELQAAMTRAAAPAPEAVPEAIDLRPALDALGELIGAAAIAAIEE